MTPDKIIVTVGGIVGIIFTYWFFLMRKDNVVQAEDSIDIIVDGGYSPETISIPQAKMTKINFIRRDPSGCLEEVVIPEFKVRKFLPLNKKITIEITPQNKGEFEFTCGMNMYHGKIIVK